jgi:hypothetical protein
MANATAGISYTLSFPQIRVSSTTATPIVGHLKPGKMAETLVRLWLQLAKDVSSDWFSKV